MKKILLTLIIFASLLLVVSAGTGGTYGGYEDLISRPFVIQAGVKDVVEVYVNRIPSQSSDLFALGMPFDIENSLAQFKGDKEPATTHSEVFGNGSGLLIADWGFIVNKPFSLNVTANPLKHVTDTTSIGHELNYSLVFEFSISYKITGGDRKQKNASIIYDGANNKLLLKDASVATPVAQVIIDGTNNGVSISNLIEGSSEGFIGAANGNVYFGFTYDSTQLTEKAPEGNYSAQVTLTITPDA